MLNIKPVFLYTDIFLWCTALLITIYAFHVRKSPPLRRKWAKVFSSGTACASAAVLLIFVLIAAADSFHFQRAIGSSAQGAVYSVRPVSFLDYFVGERIAGRERSYSSPFAIREFDKTSVTDNGTVRREYARLSGAGINIDEGSYTESLCASCAKGVIRGGLIALAGFGLSLLFSRKRTLRPGPFLSVVLCALFIAGVLWELWPDWHIFGTDATGNDVLYNAFKSVRTAVILGTLATASMLPFAIILGIAAGYFKGWLDDAIQYLYTTISSVPSVLLIAASVLMLQAFIDRNPGLYETELERAELTLMSLSVIIGVTGWAGLARLLRAETLKLSEMEFIRAAESFSVPAFKILLKHIFPNVTHLVLIVSVLDFSGIVLYEAVLSYVGVGVSPSTYSFGSMITSGALEMSRSPVIWWNLSASFAFMLTLVLSANLLAGSVRNAFNPRNTGKGEGNA